MSNDDPFGPLGDPRDEPGPHTRKPEPLGLIEPVQWQGRPIPPRRWLVEGIVPHGAVTMLNGDGGVGKSLLTMQLATCCAIGRDFLGIKTGAVKVLAVFCEDDADELHRRQADINRHYGIDFGDLENLRMISRVGRDNLLMVFPQKSDTGTPTAFYQQIAKAARDFGAQLIIVDTIADAFGGNENFRGQVRLFVNTLRRLALDGDGAVVVTAHPSNAGLQTGSGLSGSTAWNNSVRSRLYLTKPKADGDFDPDTNERVLRGMKSNYGEPGGKIVLQWREGVFVRMDAGSGMVASIQRRNAETAFVECLAGLVAEGHFPSAATQAQSIYAPRLMLGRPTVKGYQLRDLERAMKTVLADNRVVLLDTPGKPSRVRKYLAPAAERPAGK